MVFLFPDVHDSLFAQSPSDPIRPWNSPLQDQSSIGNQEEPLPELLIEPGEPPIDSDFLRPDQGIIQTGRFGFLVLSGQNGNPPPPGGDFQIRWKSKTYTNIGEFNNETVKWATDAILMSPDEGSMRLKQAEERFSAMMETDPQCFFCLFNGGLVFLMMDKKEQAEQAFRQAKRLVPGSISVRIHLARAYEKNKKIQSAIQELKSAYRDAPFDSRPLVALGALYNRMNRPHRGEIYLKEALKKNSFDPVARVEMAKVEYQRNEFEKALHHLRIAEKSISLDSSVVQTGGPGVVSESLELKANSLYLRAKIRVEMNQFELAKKHFQELLQIEKSPFFFHTPRSFIQQEMRINERRLKILESYRP